MHFGSVRPSVRPFSLQSDLPNPPALRPWLIQLFSNPAKNSLEQNSSYSNQC